MKTLAYQEEIKQTQKIHSSILHNIQRQLNAGQGLAEQELPVTLTFPMDTDRDEMTDGTKLPVDVANSKEQLLKDVSLQKLLVNLLQLFYNRYLNSC